jgi:Mg2+/citrate symporter
MSRNIKNLQTDTEYKKYDSDRDGNIDNDEMKKMKNIIDIENRNAKEDQRRKMAWVAMFSMLAITVLLCFNIISIERVEALSGLLQMFYIAQATVVATFFGASAFINREI